MMVKGRNIADDTLRLFMENLYLREGFPSILFPKGKLNLGGYDSNDKSKEKGVRILMDSDNGSKTLQALAEAIQSLFLGLDLERALKSAMVPVKELFRGGFISLLLWKEREQCLFPLVIKGVSQEGLSSKVCLGEGVTGWVAAEKKPVFVANYKEDPRAHPAYRPYVASFMSCPLFVEDRLYGVVSMGKGEGEGVFSQEDFSLFEKVGALLSRYLELAKLVEDGYHTFIMAIEGREPMFKGHSFSVARIAIHMADKVGLGEGEKRLLYWAGLLHDVGKIGIPDMMLVRPFTLDKRERFLVSLHAQLGGGLVSLISPLKKAGEWVLHHHERWDGKGYPSGLKGKDIPLASRVIHLAESFHAMLTDLPYREALTKDEVKGELRSGRGKQWDPRLVDLFLEDLDLYHAMVLEIKESPYPVELEEIRSEAAFTFLSVEILQDLSNLLVELSHATVAEFVEAVLERLSHHLGWEGVALLDGEGRVLGSINMENGTFGTLHNACESAVEIRWGEERYYLKVRDGRISPEEMEILENLEGFLAGLLGFLFYREGRALKDDLTQAYTLSTIVEFFPSVASRSKHLSVVLFDLDGFKEVNDRFGHEMGNEVLRRLSALIGENLRDSDFMGRYGGDEFVVLLPHAAREEATRIMARIRKRAERTPLVLGIPPITFSFGVAQYPEEGRDIHVLLRLADMRMYQEKDVRRGLAKVMPTLGGPLRLGLSCDFTGGAAYLGGEYKKGLELGFLWGEDFYGEKVELVSMDDGYEPDRCALNTQKLVEEEKVLALVGYVGTPTAAVIAPYAEEGQVPFLFPLSGASFLSLPLKRWVFTLRPSHAQEVEALVKVLLEKGIEDVGLFYQRDTYGWDVAEALEDSLSKHGLRMKEKGSYRRNSTSVSGALERLVEGAPSAVVMAGTWEPCALFAKGIRETGWSPLLLALSSVGGEAYAKAAGEAGEGTLVCQVVPHPQTLLPIIQEFRKLGGEEEPSHASLEGFLAAILFVEALRSMGSGVGRESLVRSLETLNEVEIGGVVFNLSGGNHQALSTTYLTMVRGGKLLSIQDSFSLSS